jgi:3'-5' exoribonuclease
MRQLFLRDCQAGDLIEDVYVITNKQIAAGSNGKQYIKAFVADRSATVTARMWNATRDMFGAMPDSGFLRIRARVENYQNNLQVIIEQMWPAKDGTFEICDLVPQTTKNIGQMFERLTEILGSIQNRHLAALVSAYTDDERLMEQFRKAPAAQSFHHAFLGGLLEHTLNAVEVSDAVCPFYPGLNRDLVIAGVFLHDIAKTWELTYDCSFGYTDGGHLVGHIVKSALWVEEKRREAEATLGERIPQPLIDVIQHIILSHHGLTEFGSPKTPATPEALIVHALENLDAKLMMALSACRGEAGPNGDANWTEYMKAFGGKMYRPDVAPADAQDGEPLPESEDKPGKLGEPAPAPTLKLAITNPLFESAPGKR